MFVYALIEWVRLPVVFFNEFENWYPGVFCFQTNQKQLTSDIICMYMQCDVNYVITKLVEYCFE